MAFGYGIAKLVSLAQKRISELRPTFGLIGIVLLTAFLFLRALNWGDPNPWAPQSQTLFTSLSFVNLEKYPPSIDFLLMTLGIMFCCLAVADFSPSFITRFLVNLGQVPLFFYLTHIVLIHFLPFSLLLSVLDTQNGFTEDLVYSGLKRSLGIRRTTAYPGLGRFTLDTRNRNALSGLPGLRPVQTLP